LTKVKNIRRTENGRWTKMPEVTTQEQRTE
jgi:hypothetical protein